MDSGALNVLIWILTLNILGLRVSRPTLGLMPILSFCLVDLCGHHGYI